MPKHNHLRCEPILDGKTDPPTAADRISRDTWAENILKGDKLREREYQIKQVMKKYPGKTIFEIIDLLCKRAFS